jgi:hypothetical protein
MRLSRIAKPFDDPDYVFELKHDGFRVLAYIGASECKVVSRNLNQFQWFASLKESLGKMLVQNAITWIRRILCPELCRKADLTRNSTLF